MPFLRRLTSLAGGRCAADSPLQSSFCFSSSWARSVCSFLTWVPTSAGHPGFASLLVSSSLGSLVPAPAPPSLPNYLLRTLEAAASGRGAAASRDPTSSPATAEVSSLNDVTPGGPAPGGHRYQARRPQGRRPSPETNPHGLHFPPGDGSRCPKPFQADLRDRS